MQNFTASDSPKRRSRQQGELSANLLRITQTESKIKREKISGQDALNQAHYQIGQRICSTIQDLGGVLPEEQPTPEKTIRQKVLVKKP